MIPSLSEEKTLAARSTYIYPAWISTFPGKRPALTALLFKSFQRNNPNFFYFR